MLASAALPVIPAALSHPAESSAGRMLALDGLRGLAILLVILEHGLPWWTLDATPLSELVGLDISMGWIGVELFFVLSGFLITGILLRTRHQPNYYTGFWLRRAFRILPVYLLLLVFVFLLLPQLPGATRMAPAEIETLPYYLLFLVNLFPVAGFEPHRLLTLTWSLAVEQQFYLFWPLVCRRLSAQGVLKLCLAILLAMPLLRMLLLGLDLASAEAIYYLGYTHCDGLAVGAAIAAARHADDALSRRCIALLRRYGALLLVGCVGITTLAAWWTPVHGMMEIEIACRMPMQVAGYSLFVLMFGWLLLCVTGIGGDSVARHVFAWTPLRGLGLVSYSLYLWHMPFVLLLWSRKVPTIGRETIALCVAIAVSALLYYGYERWFVRLGQRLSA